MNNFARLLNLFYFLYIIYKLIFTSKEYIVLDCLIVIIE